MLHKEQVEKLVQVFHYLKRRGEISFRKAGEDYEIILTEKGEKHLGRINFDNLAIKRPLAWDKKFWAVASDIPVKYKRGADAFREKIKELGLFGLQESLWFYPFDPRGEIEFVSRMYGVSEFVTAMKIEHMDKYDYDIVLDYFRQAGILNNHS